MSLKPDVNPRAFLNIDALEHQASIKGMEVHHVAPQVIQNEVDGVVFEEVVGGYSQRAQHKAIFDLIEEGDHMRAAVWIAAGFMSLAAPSLVKTAKYGATPGATMLRTDDEMVAVEARRRAYAAWVEECKQRRGIDPTVAVDIIVHGISITGAGADRQQGRKWARRQLVQGLEIFEELQRWNGRSPRRTEEAA
jgi:hypothetical protein